ncbi:MAG: UDP-N-acetylmuramoyl-tripeptide--D-alanyl-D-alanine ligase [Candidatus Nanopelagicales bacterium]
MIALTLGEVADAVGGRLAGGADAAAAVTGFSTDSRSARPGDLFVAVVGEHHDAHDFAGQAVQSGAVAALASRELDVPCVVVDDDTVAALGRLARSVLDRMPGLVVVGITGSSGKTSTKDLMAQVVSELGPVVAPQGSFNTEVGLPLTALQVDDGTRVLVAEMGARGLGHIAYLCTIAPPRIGVVLNVGSAHVGEFGSRENIARTKGELVESVPPADRGGVAVLNADDPLVAGMALRTSGRVVRYGRSADADVRAEDEVLDDEGRARFTLVAAGVRAPVSLQLHGAHHVLNALAVAATALELGIPVDVVARRLSGAVAASRWRMEVSTTAAGVTIVNDAYNANPESVLAALDALVSMSAATPTRPARRTWAVLGEMRELGELAEQSHREVGRAAAERGIDHVVAVGTGASGVATGAEGVGGATVVSAVADVQEAVELVAGGVAPGDVVLVKASRAAGLERLALALTEVPA